MHKRAVVLFVALLLAGLANAASAQVVGPRLGMIPGTNMTRDEFRARAQADLAAIALNAVTYLVVNNSYAPDFYTLQSSRAWNIDVTNMFSGRRLQAVYFEPSAQDLTTDPWLGLNNFNMGSDPPLGDDSVGKIGPDGKVENLKIVQSGGPARVNPDAIRDFDAGDVFYYTRGEMLQLIIYAPDGSYVEWVDAQPNLNYRNSVQLKPDQPADNVYAAQVLYYVDRLAAQHYNLVQFMAGQTTIPGAAVADLPGSKKIELAGRIGINVLNPVTRKPETAAKECSPGVILEGTPLKICTAAGPSLALTEMTMAREDPGQYPATKPKAKPAPKPKPGQRPPGGKTPGAPGGGRSR